MNKSSYLIQLIYSDYAAADPHQQNCVKFLKGFNSLTREEAYDLLTTSRRQGDALVDNVLRKDILEMIVFAIRNAGDPVANDATVNTGDWECEGATYHILKSVLLNKRQISFDMNPSFVVTVYDRAITDDAVLAVKRLAAMMPLIREE